jgi:hypothetical protein
MTPAARHKKARSHFYNGDPYDAVSSSHRRGRQSTALEEPSGAGVEDDQVLRVEDNPGGIALPPLDP